MTEPESRLNLVGVYFKEGAATGSILLPNPILASCKGSLIHALPKKQTYRRHRIQHRKFTDLMLLDLCLLGIPGPES